MANDAPRRDTADEVSKIAVGEQWDAERYGGLRGCSASDRDEEQAHRPNCWKALLLDMNSTSGWTHDSQIVARIVLDRLAIPPASNVRGTGAEETP